MARFNATAGSYDTKPFEILPTDIYRMKIVRADIQQNTFAEKKEDDTYPDQLVLTWEVTQIIGEQDEGVVGLSVWQRLAPWYGDTKRGPSKFKQLVDSLVEQKLLADDIDLDDIDTDWFVGIEQRVNVEEYIKTMGANQGQPGNRVLTVLPLLKKPLAKSAPQRPQAAVRKNTPQPVAAGEMSDGEEIPF